MNKTNYQMKMSGVEMKSIDNYNDLTMITPDGLLPED